MDLLPMDDTIDLDDMPPEPEPPPDDWQEQPQAEQAPDDQNGYLLGESYDHEGHARCLAAIHPGEFAYSEHLGWMRYNGRFWQREGAELRVERAAVEVLKMRRIAAVEAEREPLVKASRGDRRNVTGTRDQFRSMVVVSVNDFDRDPDLVNCNNGVLDLRTGELRPHHPEQRFSYCLPVDYDPEADYSLWLNFLSEATGGVAEVMAWLKLAVGYSLTGHTWEEILFYLYGPTRSGKGTFTETLLRMFGNKPLAVETDFQTFTAERSGDTQNFDLAPLKPCRFVAASESNKHQPLNPAKIKQLTGGNYVYCAFKHREHFGYRPQFKIWLASNHPVNVDVDDSAAWARVRVIEFPNSYLGREDKALKQRLSEPASLRGVLRWAVEGACLWYAAGGSGLPHPEKIKRDTQTQRAKQDFIQQFLDERTKPNPEGYIHSGALWEIYKAWCDSNGVPAKLQNQFSQALETKGFHLSRKRIDGALKRVIMGLGCDA